MSDQYKMSTLWLEFCRSFVLEEIEAEVAPTRAVIVFMVMIGSGWLLNVRHWYLVSALALLGTLGALGTYLTIKHKTLNIKALVASQVADIAGYSGAIIMAALLTRGSYRVAFLFTYFTTVAIKWSREYTLTKVSFTVFVALPFIYMITLSVYDKLVLLTLLFSAIFYWQMSLGTLHQRLSVKTLQVKDEVLRRVVEVSTDKVKLAHMAPAMFCEIKRILLPVDAAISYAQQAIADDPDGIAMHFQASETVRSRVRRAIDLTNDCLFVLSIDEFSFELSEVSELEIQLANSKTTVSFCFPSVRVVGTKEIFSLVLRNLAKNAIENGARVIRCDVAAENNSTIKLSFRDNGAGIPQHKLHAIFTRSVPQNPENGSKGISLWLCSKLMNACDGHLTLVSTTQLGTEFEILFNVQLEN